MINTRFIIPFISGAVLLAVFASLACGKKGDPILSRKDFSARVVDLQGEMRGRDLILKGRITGLGVTEKAKDLVRGCRLIYGQYPINHPPCEYCPMEYPDSYEYGPEVIDSEGLSVKMPGLIRGRIYFIKVRLIGSGGAVGPLSTWFRIAVE